MIVIIIFNTGIVRLKTIVGSAKIMTIGRLRSNCNDAFIDLIAIIIINNSSSVIGRDINNVNTILAMTIAFTIKMAGTITTIKDMISEFC